MDQVFSTPGPEKTRPVATQGLANVKARILVAPLDWGLGHATRCIPLIKELLANDCAVWLAGEGAQEELLKKEFPELPFLQLPGYRIRYARSKYGLAWKLLLQWPRLKKTVQEENIWLKDAVKKYSFDAVISDNRYGLHHPSIPCIFITHQLTIKSFFGSWLEKILQRINYRYINRFTECWVPDNESRPTLAGGLSHPEKMPSVPVRYTGPLSRFTKQETAEQKNHLLILLSGPEPQRSILEKKILEEISHYPGTATIVRGFPGSSSIVPSTSMIQVYNHLPAAALAEEINKAEWVISRSGYSTVMDMTAMQKECILIPTPGQTEQEYLALYLSENRIAPFLQQKDFSIDTALEKAKQFPYVFLPANNDNGLKKVIKGLIYSLKK